MRVLSGAALIGSLLLASLVSGARAAEKGGHEKEGGRFGLSEDQEAKLREASLARRKAVALLREDLRDEVETLKRQVREEAGDKKIQGTLDRLQKLRKDMLAEKEKFKDKAASFLTPTQQAKLLMAMHGRKHGGRRHGDGRGLGGGRGDGEGKERGGGEDREGREEHEGGEEN